MIQCSRCDTENSDVQAYCERCGNVLPQSAHATTFQRDYAGSPTGEYSGLTRLFSYQNQNQKIFPSRPRITLLRILRAIFYFILAVPITAIGLFGTLESYTHSQRMTGFALFITIGLIAASVVLFYHVRRRVQRLGWVHLIWWILGTTVGLFMAAILDATFFPDWSNGGSGSHIFGVILLLYGVILACVALW